jgi:general secretion pathway protein A
VYPSFYGLAEKPFNATPDPRFLYFTPAHREALAQLVYGIRENRGFLMLTGEVGTGKTTLIHALLSRLDGNTAVAFIFNSTLPFDGILEYMLEDFGVAKVGDTRAQRLFALNNFLIERRRAGQNAVLIIDEAQNLDSATLEQIRLLSNFETPTDKLLQILLAGQPELKATLELPELRQLRQRISLRCTIRPMTRKETTDYVHTRLRIAGGRDLHLFTDRALDRIAKYSGGIPRVVNILCDHSLLIGYADQDRRIDEGVVKQAIAYLDGTATGARRSNEASGRRRLLPWVAGLAGLAVVSGVLLVTHPETLGELHRAARELSATATALVGAVRDTLVP